MTSPGPWRWEQGEGNAMAVLFDAAGNIVCHFGDSEPYYPSEGQEPSDANMALIASAPTLAADNARLRDLLREWFGCDTVEKSADWQARACAALGTK